MLEGEQKMDMTTGNLGQKGRMSVVYEGKQSHPLILLS